jgi:PEP-CTERM motif
MKRRVLVVALGAVALLALPHRAAASPIGPVPYLSFADSPFSGRSFSWFYLEDFEDGLLNTPGVSVGPASVAIAVGGFTDSVDGDDGVIDGSGSNGHSLWSNFATSVIAFDFSAAVLGDLPTHVGLVWTDVGNVSAGSYGFAGVTFEAFDQNGATLGISAPIVLGDGAISGQTAEDRFFGAINDGGISRIEIRSPDTNDWEVDHLQYGFAPQRALEVEPVPEPATFGLLLTGLGFVVRKRRLRHGYRNRLSADQTPGS